MYREHPPTMVSAAPSLPPPRARDGMMEYLVLYHNGGSIDDTRRGTEGRASERGVTCGTYTHRQRDKNLIRVRRRAISSQQLAVSYDCCVQARILY